MLLCITVACEIFYSNNANKEIILRLEKDHYSKKVAEMSSKWLNSYFKQIELIISILSKNDVFVNGKLGFADFEELFKEGLEKTPFALSYYVGFKDDTYLQVFHPNNTHQLNTFRSNPSKALPDYVSYAIQRMEKKDGLKISESWDYFDKDFSHITNEYLENASFVPKKRVWYIHAEQEKKPIWTDVYVFEITHLPGITVASPIIEEKTGEVEGVIAVDFVIEEFKELLSTVKATERSSVRLINSKNEIVASTFDDDKFKTEENGTVVLPKIVDTDDEVLAGAAKGLLGTNDSHVTHKAPNGAEYVAYMQKLDRVPFSLLMITPLADFTDDFDQISHSMALLSILIFLIASGVVFCFSRTLSKPITELCKSATAIGAMNWNHYSIPPKSRLLEIRDLSSAMDSMRLSIFTFSKYAPKDLVKKLLKNETKAEIGGRTREVTMFFSDIEKFTTVSEKLPAEYLVLHLSEYFNELTNNIISHQGTIDKYIGDSIMAMWGAPNSDEDQVMHACEAALDCQRILDELAKKWQPLGKPPLPTRIGLHTGQAIVGNVGSADRMNFTAIGSTVDIASNLEGVNKIYGTKILASGAVEEKARSKILFRIIDKIAFEGINSDITIYEPLCALKNANDMYYDLMELCTKSKEAFELFQAHKFEEALKLYKEIMKLFPERKSSVLPLVERCEKFIKTPPKNWNGVNFLGDR